MRHRSSSSTALRIRQLTNQPERSLQTQGSPYEYRPSLNRAVQSNSSMIAQLYLFPTNLHGGGMVARCSFRATTSLTKARHDDTLIQKRGLPPHIKQELLTTTIILCNRESAALLPEGSWKGPEAAKTISSGSVQRPRQQGCRYRRPAL